MVYAVLPQPPHFLPGMSSAIPTCRASASFSIVSSVMFRWPRSISDTKVRCSPASSARCSCEIFRFVRTIRNRAPNLLRTSPLNPIPFANEVPWIRLRKLSVRGTIGLQTSGHQTVSRGRLFVVLHEF
jgi:hypothetical protein